MVLREDALVGEEANTPIGLLTLGASGEDAGCRKVFFSLGRWIGVRRKQVLQPIGFDPLRILLHLQKRNQGARCARPRPVDTLLQPMFGEWLSLVEHLVRDQGVGGSNPLSPTI